MTDEESIFWLRNPGRLEGALQHLIREHPVVSRCYQAARAAKLSDTTAAEFALVALAQSQSDPLRWAEKMTDIPAVPEPQPKPVNPDWTVGDLYLSAEAMESFTIQINRPILLDWDNPLAAVARECHMERSPFFYESRFCQIYSIEEDYIHRRLILQVTHLLGQTSSVPAAND